MSNFSNPTIAGRIVAVGDTKTFASGFTVRELILDNGGNWPNPIPVRFCKDRTALLDSVKPGERVSVEYRLSGREWNGQYFCDVQGLSIAAHATTAKSASAEPTTAEVEAAFTNTNDDDNIPF